MTRQRVTTPRRMRWYSAVALFLVLFMMTGVHSFILPADSRFSTITATTTTAANVNFLKQRQLTTSLFLSSNDENNMTKKQKKNKGMDEGVRNKLLAESIAPWRGLRLFLYGSLGSGAFIGGFITLTGLLAAVTQSSGDDVVDLNTEYLNLAIDFGAVAIFAFLFKFDSDKQGELDEKVAQQVEEKKAKRKAVTGMKEREKALGTLELNIQVSMDGDVQRAPIRELQAGAKQNMIIVVGPKKACRDALVGANLLKMDFAMSNVLVVPYETGANVANVRPDGGGFGDNLPSFETQPYVARPVGEGWEDFVSSEMDDAVKQNGENAREEGIAIVVSSSGKVVRRGVGIVPWRQIVEELQST